MIRDNLRFYRKNLRKTEFMHQGVNKVVLQEDLNKANPKLTSYVKIPPSKIMNNESKIVISNSN